MDQNFETVPEKFEISQKSFFAGQEEVFARIISLLLSSLFFVIFTVAKETVTLKWDNVLYSLGIFWIIYESLSLLLFQIFKFFAKKNNVITTQKDETTGEN